MEDIIQIAAMAAIGICVLMSLPLAIGLMRRMSRPIVRPSLPAADIIARLERMEQGMEAIATEVERISEGRRFTTKLLNSNSESAHEAAHSIPSRSN